ncbi:hypothetical protein [Methylobacterium sp. P5_C11]
MCEYVTIVSAEKSALYHLRIRAKKHGTRIEKVRGQQHLNQRCGIQLNETWDNTVLAGVDYELTVSQAAHWADRYIAERG